MRTKQKMNSKVANISDRKRDNFVRLAEARVTKTIKYIRLISNLANKSTYKYSDKEVKRIFDALDAEIKAAKERFRSPLGVGRSFEFRLDG